MSKQGAKKAFAKYKKVYDQKFVSNANRAIKALNNLIAHDKKVAEGEYEIEEREDVTESYSGDLDDTVEGDVDISDTGTISDSDRKPAYGAAQDKMVREFLAELDKKDLTERARGIYNTIKTEYIEANNASEVYENNRKAAEVAARKKEFVRYGIEELISLAKKGKLEEM